VVHNELEKTRRAQLRCHLDSLAANLPPVGANESNRHTTLNLLNRTSKYIEVSNYYTNNMHIQINLKTLETREKQLTIEKAQLVAEAERLQCRLAELTNCQNVADVTIDIDDDVDDARPDTASTISCDEHVHNGNA
jgi:hypothetical protein